MDQHRGLTALPGTESARPFSLFHFSASNLIGYITQKNKIIGYYFRETTNIFFRLSTLIMELPFLIIMLNTLMPLTQRYIFQIT